MTMQTFDPYYHWLGIPPHEQPPNYYRLVGAPLYEPNPAVIAAAADRWLGFLAGMSQSEFGAAANRLYQEISYAKMYLCHPQQKAAYDAWLQQMAASGSSISRASGSTISGNPAPASPSASGIARAAAPPVNPSASGIARGAAPPVSPSASSISRGAPAPAASGAAYPQNPNYGSSYGSTGYAPIPTVPGASSISAAPSAVPQVPQVPQAPMGYGAPAAPVAPAPAPAAPTGPVVKTDEPASLAKREGFNPITFAAVGGSLVAVGIVVLTMANAKPTKTAQQTNPEPTAAPVVKPVVATPVETPRTEPTTPKTPTERPIFKPVVTTPSDPVAPTKTPEAPAPETPAETPEEAPAVDPAMEKPVKPAPETPAMEEPAVDEPAMTGPNKTKPNSGDDAEMAAEPNEKPAPGDNTGGLSAVTPTTTETAPTETPTEATPQQQMEFDRFIKAAKLALSEREFEAASQEIEKAKKVAITDEQKAALARCVTMHEQLTQLWDGITQQMNLMVAGQEFEVKGKIVIVVETSDKMLIARASGKQYRWDPKSMPTSIARWISEQWFKPDAAYNVMLGTHYLLDKEGKDPLVARSLWDQAAGDPNGKVIVEELRPEL